MDISIPEFWRLSTESGLLSIEQCQQLDSRFTQTAANTQAGSKPLAQWLVSQNVLSRYQARVLLSGKAGPFQYGDYKIYDRIAAGRLQGLFRAVHAGTNHPVTLYFLTRAVAEDDDRWARATELPRIEHPQLSRCLQVVDLGTYKYLVWEDLRGAALDEPMTPNQGMSAIEACCTVHLAATGLARLHELRAAHGDIRPCNLWREPNGNVKLLVSPEIDLGPLDHPLSPVAQSAKGPSADNLLERAGYWAPELAQPGQLPDARTDIYALGCTLYELIAGRTAFPGRTVGERLQRHTGEPIPEIGAGRAPVEVLRLVGRMMAKRPDDRLNQAAVVAQQLEPFARQALANLKPPPVVATQVAFDRWLQTLGAASSHGALGASAAIARDEPRDTVSPSSEVKTPQIQIPEPKSSPNPMVPAGRDRGLADRVARGRAQRRTATVMLLAGFTVFTALSGVVLFVLNSDLLNSPASNQANDSTAESPAASSNGEAAQRGTGPTGENDSESQQWLWASPTDGPPIELNQLPRGAQLFLVVRLAELLDSEEGRRVFRALGPDFAETRNQWEQAAGCNLEEVDRLTIALYANAGMYPKVVCVVQLSADVSESELIARWGTPAAHSLGEHKYFQTDDWSFFVPPGAARGMFLMGADDLIQEAAQADAGPALLRRELGSLLRASDQQRHVSLLFAPNFLFSDGRRVFSGTRAKLLDPLESLLGDSLKACLVSAHFGEPLYVELRMLSDVVVDRFTLANSFRDRLEELPDVVETYMATLNPHPYWRRVAFRFPGMVGFVARQLRVGVEDSHALLNVALPESAAHNLVFGTEMALASTPAVDLAPPPEEVVGPQSIEPLLAEKMSVSFDQESLDAALRDLEADIRGKFPKLPFEFKITIIGDDLEMEGITRNQQIRDFSQQDRPVSAILTAIAMAANPVTTVELPTEEDQKLVWVIAPDPSNPSNRIILFTTRQAAKQKYSLTEPFVSK